MKYARPVAVVRATDPPAVALAAQAESDRRCGS